MLEWYIVALAQILLVKHANSSPAKSSLIPTATQSFFKYEDVGSVLPLAPSWYPKGMQGILWHDQAGCYGHSDVSKAALQPVLCTSFGDTAFSVFDNESRIIHVAVKGPAWQFNNVPGAYPIYDSGLSYEVTFNREFTSADWQPSQEDEEGVAVKWKMEKKTHSSDECPPKPGASIGAKSKCAAWQAHMFVPCGRHCDHFGPKYQIFQVVDSDGKKVQPYFDAYVACASKAQSGRNQLDGESFVGQWNDAPIFPLAAVSLIVLVGAGISALVASKMISLPRAAPAGPREALKSSPGAE